MTANIRNGKKRTFSEISENCSVSPKKMAQSSIESPKSSPLKGPLHDNGAEVGSKSFVAKCFYGFKRSSKADWSSPERKYQLVHQKEVKWKIFQDPILNDKILERIDNSPVKQAFLRSCSVEEFRKVYRDEIKEVELEDKLNNNRLTRSASKIVYRRNNSDDEVESEDDCTPFVDNDEDDEITFKISNRGFDVDSASDCSSNKVQSPASLKGKCTIRSTPSKKMNADLDNLSDCTESERSVSPSPVSSASSETPGRKFFKSKSVRDSVNSGSVVVGRNFNLRFVSRSHGKDMKAKKKKMGASSIKPRRLSLGDKAKSPLFFSNPINVNKTSVMILAPKKDEVSLLDDDFLDDLVVKKDSKTYEELPVQNKSSNDLPVISNSIPESEQVSAENDTHQPSPTESSLLSNEAVDESSECQNNGKRGSTNRRLFPIFTTENSTGIRGSSKSSPKLSGKKVLNTASVTKDSQSQMIIDAGQKKFGATQCTVCGMVYCHADPMDEAEHDKFHNRLLEVLKFKGWKSGREVQEFPIDCGRVVMVMSDDPKYCRKKVEEIYELMARDLGFPGDNTPFRNPYQKVFFYVSLDKRIEGCCVAEAIKEGNRVIPGDLDSGSASGRRPWCCDKKVEPAVLGISRLWVTSSSRRSGIATRLVDSVRQWFDYGSLIPKNLVAFSDPTPDGRKFAERYFGTRTFLVYKYH